MISVVQRLKKLCFLFSQTSYRTKWHDMSSFKYWLSLITNKAFKLKFTEILVELKVIWDFSGLNLSVSIFWLRSWRVTFAGIAAAPIKTKQMWGSKNCNRHIWVLVEWCRLGWAVVLQCQYLQRTGTLRWTHRMCKKPQHRWQPCEGLAPQVASPSDSLKATEKWADEVTNFYSRFHAGK